MNHLRPAFCTHNECALITAKKNVVLGQLGGHSNGMKCFL